MERRKLFKEISPEFIAWVDVNEKERLIEWSELLMKVTIALPPNEAGACLIGWLIAHYEDTL